MMNFFPFTALKPKKKQEETGPYYADIQARGLAAAVDLLILFTLLQKPFDWLTRRLYANADQGLIAQAREATVASKILQLLWQSHLPQWWMINSAIQIFCIGILYVGCQCWLKTTPGKWLLGLRIVDSNTFEPLPRWRYAFRFLTYLPACAPLMLGIFWMSFNKRRRGWHDMLARTVVIHTHPRGYVWQQTQKAWRWMRARLFHQRSGDSQP